MQKRNLVAVAVLGAALLQGCGEKREPGVYALPPQEAFARLENADIEGFRDRRQCGVLIHFTRSAQSDSITWRVTSSDRPVARFTVRLTPEGQGTRATIEVPQAPDGGEIYDGTKMLPRPALQQPLRPAVQELIDAAMEQRPFDVLRMPEPRNIDRVCSLQKSGLQRGRPFAIDDFAGSTAAESRRIRDDREARREAEQARETRDFGKPMMRPGGY